MMEERSVKHDTFVIERTYRASPGQVFSAWSNPEAKAKWFPKAQEFDFRVGGREFNRTPNEGVVYTYEAHYQDIVADQRIVYSYAMDRGQTRISVSIATVEFKPVGSGTRLIYTEQGAFLDGEDKPEFRRHGTEALLDALGIILEHS